MILYRGMSIAEKKIYETKEFNNISWWTTEFPIAQVRSSGAIVKINIELTEEDETEFKNSMHGRDIEYEGFGKKPNTSFYSISGNLLKEKMVSFEFIEEIVPNANYDVGDFEDYATYKVNPHFVNKTTGEIRIGYDKLSGLMIKELVKRGAIPYHVNEDMDLQLYIL